MAYIASVGLGIPEHKVSQQEVKELVQQMFTNNRRMGKLLPVFDNALVAKRQLVKEPQFYKENHSFKEKNSIYVETATALALDAIDQCLTQTACDDVNATTVDAIIFVSSSGIATPSLDAHLINECDFREDIVRMPLWGLGCAGGAMGLSRGFEWLQANPDKTAMVVACELCSMTFQNEDDSMSNMVATALFGDGAAAALLVGEDSPYKKELSKHTPSIQTTSSQLTKNTKDVMGWKVTDGGLEVVFSKRIPKLVPDMWQKHVARFLRNEGMKLEEIKEFLAHPGGRKVLEAMQETFDLTNERLRYAYEVLLDHGNMSSATVLYVLKKWMEAENSGVKETEYSLVSALGPGFSSELLLLKRDPK